MTSGILVFFLTDDDNDDSRPHTLTINQEYACPLCEGHLQGQTQAETHEEKEEKDELVTLMKSSNL